MTRYIVTPLVFNIQLQIKLIDQQNQLLFNIFFINISSVCQKLSFLHKTEY